MSANKRRDPQGNDEGYEVYFSAEHDSEATIRADFDQEPLENQLSLTEARIRRYRLYVGRLYANGSPLDEVLRELEAKTTLMLDGAAFLRTEGPQFEDEYLQAYPVRTADRRALAFLALGLLLIGSKSELDRFTQLLSPEEDDRLYLVDLLVHAFAPQYPIAGHYAIPKEHVAWTAPVLRALGLPPDERAAALAAHMKNWCRIMRPWGWKPNLDTSFGHDRLFSDFAFEVALAVCAYDIDDTGFRDHAYYPADLVDHYRATIRRTRDGWRPDGVGAGVPVVVPPAPVRADLDKSKRKGVARWIELVCDGDNDAVEEALDIVGKPKKVKAIGQLLEAVGSQNALLADMKDDETVEAVLSQIADARGLDGFTVPAGPPFGPARCSTMLLAFADWVTQRGYVALALDDGWDNWAAVLVRTGYREELLQLSGTLGIVVNDPGKAWPI